MATKNQRGYGLKRAVVEILGAPLTASTATTVATVANTLVAGQRVSVTAVGGSDLSLLTTYYVIATGLDATKFSVSTTYGGTAATMGTGTGVVFQPLDEIELHWPNKATVSADNTDLQWEGGDAIEKLTQMLGLSVEIDLDCMPISAHRSIFSKTEMTALPGGYTSGTGIGGGDDVGGVACGFYLEGNAIKTVGGVKTTVTRRRWVPSGVITLRTLGELGTGAKAGATGYTITASRTTVDMLGVTIANTSTGGDFIIDMD
jgi:hypothetical protein